MRPNYEFNPTLYPSNMDAWYNAGCRGTVSNVISATGRYVGGRGKRVIRNNKTRNNKTRHNKTRHNKTRHNKTKKAKVYY